MADEAPAKAPFLKAKPAADKASQQFRDSYIEQLAVTLKESWPADAKLPGDKTPGNDDFKDFAEQLVKNRKIVIREDASKAGSEPLLEIDIARIQGMLDSNEEKAKVAKKKLEDQYGTSKLDEIILTEDQLKASSVAMHNATFNNRGDTEFLGGSTWMNAIVGFVMWLISDHSKSLSEFIGDRATTSFKGDLTKNLDYIGTDAFNREFAGVIKEPVKPINAGVQRAIINGAHTEARVMAGLEKAGAKTTLEGTTLGANAVALSTMMAAGDDTAKPPAPDAAAKLPADTVADATAKAAAAAAAATKLTVGSTVPDSKVAEKRNLDSLLAERSVTATNDVVSLTVNGQTHHYKQVAQTSRADSKTGFAGAVWVETDAKGKALTDTAGKSELIATFPGYTGKISDKTPETHSLAMASLNALSPQVTDAAALIGKANDKFGKDNIAGMRFEAHSFGTANAEAAYMTAAGLGIKTVSLHTIDPVVANSSAAMLKETLDGKHRELNFAKRTPPEVVRTSRDLEAQWKQMGLLDAGAKARMTAAHADFQDTSSASKISTTRLVYKDEKENLNVTHMALLVPPSDVYLNGGKTKGGKTQIGELNRAESDDTRIIKRGTTRSLSPFEEDSKSDPTHENGTIGRTDFFLVAKDQIDLSKSNLSEQAPGFQAHRMDAYLKTSEKPGNHYLTQITQNGRKLVIADTTTPAVAPPAPKVPTAAVPPVAPKPGPKAAAKPEPSLLDASPIAFGALADRVSDALPKVPTLDDAAKAAGSVVDSAQKKLSGLADAFKRTKPPATAPTDVDPAKPAADKKTEPTSKPAKTFGTINVAPVGTTSVLPPEMAALFETLPAKPQLNDADRQTLDAMFAPFILDVDKATARAGTMPQEKPLDITAFTNTPEFDLPALPVNKPGVEPGKDGKAARK